MKGDWCPIGSLNLHTYNAERTECIWCGPGRERDLLILEAKDAGVPVTHIAEAIGLHRNHVHRILREHESDYVKKNRSK